MDRVGEGLFEGCGADGEVDEAAGLELFEDAGDEGLFVAGNEPGDAHGAVNIGVVFELGFGGWVLEGGGDAVPVAGKFFEAPEWMSMTRSASSSTSVRLWLVRMMVLPRFFSSARVPRSRAASMGSRPTVGSSSSRMGALALRPTAMWRRCFMPLEYSSTRR